MSTIYLTNAASRNPPYRGPGHVWSIMAAPRPQYGEAGEGTVNDLVPMLGHLQALKAGEMTLEQYREHYIWELHHLTGPLGSGHLWASARPPNPARPRTVFGWKPVADGDTLICCCSRAEAAKGRCHRVWAAQALAEAGWEVILDGKPLVLEAAP